MGLFSKLFGNEKKPEKDCSYIVSIAENITGADEAVLSPLRECVADPWGYGEKNAERYDERGIDTSDRDETDADEICWIGMVDELAENGYLFSTDYNSDPEDFLWGLSKLKSYNLIEAVVSGMKLDETLDIDAWGEEINLALNEKAFVCMIDIDSDSYEVIIVTHDVYEKISAITENNGHSIEIF